MELLVGCSAIRRIAPHQRVGMKRGDRVGKSIVNEATGNTAPRPIPGATEIARILQSIQRNREQQIIGGGALLVNECIQSNRFLTDPSPGCPFVGGNEKAEVGRRDDLVELVAWKQDADSIRKRSVGASRVIAQA